MDSHYQTLGIPEDASAEDVRRAYKARLLVVHPDKAAGSTSGLASEPSSKSASTLARIQEAYAVLKDPGSRDLYDESLRGRRIFEESIDVYDEVFSSDLTPSADGSLLTYPCRCGDDFAIDTVQCQESTACQSEGERGWSAPVEYMLECSSCSLRLLVRCEETAD